MATPPFPSKVDPAVLRLRPSDHTSRNTFSVYLQRDSINDDKKVRVSLSALSSGGVFDKENSRYLQPRNTFLHTVPDIINSLSPDDAVDREEEEDELDSSQSRDSIYKAGGLNDPSLLPVSLSTPLKSPPPNTSVSPSSALMTPSPSSSSTSHSYTPSNSLLYDSILLTPLKEGAKGLVLPSHPVPSTWHPQAYSLNASPQGLIWITVEIVGSVIIRNHVEYLVKTTYDHTNSSQQKRQQHEEDGDPSEVMAVVTKRRYRDFLSLRRKLSRLGYFPPASLPPKGAFGKLLPIWRSRETRESRSHKLEHYIGEVIKLHTNMVERTRKKRMGGGGFEGKTMEMVADVVIKSFLQSDTYFHSN